jgi:L-ascorbate metabolism protein UlaG (beta-lactamase superfamily)
LTAPFDGKRFSNPEGPEPHAFGEFLRWRFTRKPASWPGHVANPPAAKPPMRVDGDDLLVTYVGHVTILIQTAGLNILTDPVWSTRASPSGWAGPKRVRAPGIAFDALPKIDLVLVSHNHYDHLDVVTLRRLWQRDRPCIVTPLGNARIMGLAADEVDWGESLAIGNRARIVTTPLQHWSARSFTDRNEALWAGFVIDVPGGAVFFAGDTGLGSGWWIDPVRTAVSDLRLALLPIGAYEPRWFMAGNHMNPTEAIQAFQRLGARHALATHFGVFPLADDGFDDAERAFLAARADAGVPPETFRTLQPGEHWRLA